jgi:DegV family protein with EDD domain
MVKTKSSIGIIAGEDTDLPIDFIKEHNIKIYNFNLIWEGVLQNSSDIYKKMRESLTKKGQGAPYTSQPSVGVLKEIYESSLKEHNELFVVTISSKLSGCYSCALQAVTKLKKEQQSKVHVIESSFFSSGSAFLVQELIHLLNQGLSTEDIQKKVEAFQTRITMIGMIEDSVWLQKGGRISPAVAMILNQMKKVGIRPLLAAQEGKVVLLKVKANAPTKVQGIFEYFKNMIEKNNVEAIITHADNAAEAQSLSSLIQKELPQAKVLYINQLSPVVGAHVGPGALVLGWRIL